MRQGTGKGSEGEIAVGTNDAELTAALNEGYVTLKEQIHNVIVGQDAVSDEDGDGRVFL